jgi:hypothetical protein
MRTRIVDHAYQPGGPFGRCAAPDCNRRRKSHAADLPKPEIVRVPYAAPLEPDLLPSGTLPGRTIGAEVEDPAAGGFVSLGFEPLPVFFKLKRGHGQPGEEVELDWPPNWPLPIAGQTVKADLGQMGHVRDVVFDLDRKRIILACD